MNPTPFTARIDEFGRPAWIALIILGFMVWWPVGLMALAFSIGSGRMGCRSGAHWQSKMQSKMDRFRDQVMGNAGSAYRYDGPSSGNRAFDEYRSDTLRRLEDEQREFHDFLDRLRMAKDKSEFDQFMSDRRTRQTPDVQSPSQG